MKKALNLFLLGLLTLVGCQSAPTEVTDETTVPEPKEETDREYSDMWLSFGDLSFYLPEGWTVAKEMEGSEGVKTASINVPDSQYDVQLKMTMTEGTTYDVDQEPLARNQEAQVYLVPCGGAYACYALVFLDDYKREITFEVESNEPVPENLDGVWSPSTEITHDQLVQFLLGVALTPENE